MIGLLRFGAVLAEEHLPRPDWLPYFTEGCRHTIHRVFPAPYSASLVLCFLAAWLLPVLLNIRWNPRKSAWITRAHGGQLHLFLIEEFRKRGMIQFTLTDLKVYIGYIMKHPNLDPQNKYVVLLPVLSGYRDKNRELQITTNYTSLINDIRKKYPRTGGIRLFDLRVLIPLDKIASAHLFSTSIYTNIFGQKIPRISATGEHGPGTNDETNREVDSTEEPTPTDEEIQEF